MGTVVIGIDIGTQALKVLIVSGALSVLGKAAVPLQVRYPRPGWAEQDPLAWERALRRAVAAALGRADVHPRRVAAVGVTGQLDGCVAVGEEGLPLCPCPIWMDRRARLELTPEQGRMLRRETGINPDPSHLAAKARWLLDHRLSGRRGVRFHQPVSYLVSRLTDRHVLDPSLASTTMLYSLARGGYDRRLLAAFGLAEEQLPAVAAAESAAGSLCDQGARLTGLPKGVPVAVGTGDDFASPLGAGMSEPGTVACVIGTAEVVGTLCTEPRLDPQGLVETHPFPGGLYYVENPGWLAGGAVAWFQRVFGVRDLDRLNRLAGSVPATCEGLLFLPALSGAMAPEWVPAARGCFYGMTPAHGRGHFARALLEGCAYAMRDVVARLEELAEAPAKAILLMGGGSVSPLWAAIRAAVSGRRVLRCPMVDTAPMGAAMLAAVAAGIQPSLGACALRVRDWVGPVTAGPVEAAAYEAGYGAYRRLFESLRPMYEAHSGPGAGEDT